MPDTRRLTKPPGTGGETRATPTGRAGGVYSDLLTANERRALGGDEASPRDEVALLRVLVRRELQAGASAESIRRLVREIGQTVKIERSLSASEGDAIQLALDDLLAEVEQKPA